MGNNQPSSPIDQNVCVPDSPIQGYYTADQSTLNTSRTDTYILVLDIPCTLKSLLKGGPRTCNGGNLDKLQLSVWGSIIPDIKSETITHNFGGQTFKFSGNNRVSYAPVTCNFTVDNKFDNYYILYKWLELLNRTEDGVAQDYISQYSTNISLHILDEYDTRIAEFKFKDAFITELANINISSRNVKEVETSFSFEFSQLTMELV